MARLQINPQYERFLEPIGLVKAEDFLCMPAVIVCGHPDRNVAQVEIGSGPEAIKAYLKREHCIPWRDRIANAWQGYGALCKSFREAQVLQAAKEAPIGCPEWMAVGEDDRGQAFLLVRELPGCQDLRAYLAAWCTLVTHFASLFRPLSRKSVGPNA